VSSSTSTFDIVTANTKFVAKASSFIAFEDSSATTLSTIGLNTSTDRLQVEGGDAGVEFNGTGGVWVDSGIHASTATISNLTVFGETLQNGLKAVYLTNNTSAITLTETGITLASDTTLNLTSSAINIQNQANFSAGLVSGSGFAVGNYQSQITVIDSNGNWVGPAITDTPQQRVDDITSSTQIQLDSFSSSTYDTAKYLLKIRDGNDLHFVEIVLMYDGTDILKSEYGVVTNNGALGTFQADVATGNVRLLFTPTDATDMSVRIEKTLMAV
jgi:hypothetical protein